ncbi:hypothetical protein QUB25_26570 [Microcoleus sp. B3-D7]
MGAIKTIFFYRDFICQIRCKDEWVIFCTTHFYGYVGRADTGLPYTAAKEKVDRVLKLRYAKANRQNS